jgi:hypothetical protein
MNRDLELSEKKKRENKNKDLLDFGKIQRTHFGQFMQMTKFDWYWVDLGSLIDRERIFHSIVKIHFKKCHLGVPPNTIN